MHKCPCCSGQLLHYVRKSGPYWFCSHCWQEMPDLASIVAAQKQKQRLERLSSSLATVTQEKELVGVGNR
ncbi:hypothetical protein [Oscillatoria salina]|uniref:hypothetical protein n=1 Tax=Oscillatoria salina TaxID=331517 RepID=UPI0013B87AF6|nr:hypothetical protein [Oscillatoria salina]MBZ8181145.1 hypothetical protein [Oscillatoria salina IIICB1]NET91383.1 hypothetical protein [Kamptonema sp. SIO1D9]